MIDPDVVHLKRGDFQIEFLYQPIVAPNFRLVGAEALVRARRDDEMILPSDFLEELLEQEGGEAFLLDRIQDLPLSLLTFVNVTGRNLYILEKRFEDAPYVVEVGEKDRDSAFSWFVNSNRSVVFAFDDITSTDLPIIKDVHSNRKLFLKFPPEAFPVWKTDPEFFREIGELLFDRPLWEVVHEGYEGYRMGDALEEIAGCLGVTRDDLPEQFLFQGFGIGVPQSLTEISMKSFTAGNGELRFLPHISAADIAQNPRFFTDSY